ncbi:similar to Kazachstania saulgeensis KASA0Q00891g hypothetical protein (partial), partial [Maudiozyma saulgeensis]
SLIASNKKLNLVMFGIFDLLTKNLHNYVKRMAVDIARDSTESEHTTYLFPKYIDTFIHSKSTQFAELSRVSFQQKIFTSLIEKNAEKFDLEGSTKWIIRKNRVILKKIDGDISSFYSDLLKMKKTLEINRVKTFKTIRKVVYLLSGVLGSICISVNHFLKDRDDKSNQRQLIFVVALGIIGFFGYAHIFFWNDGLTICSLRTFNIKTSIANT